MDCGDSGSLVSMSSSGSGDIGVSTDGAGWTSKSESSRQASPSSSSESASADAAGGATTLTRPGTLGAANCGGKCSTACAAGESQRARLRGGARAGGAPVTAAARATRAVRFRVGAMVTLTRLLNGQLSSMNVRHASGPEGGGSEGAGAQAGAAGSGTTASRVSSSQKRSESKSESVTGGERAEPISPLKQASSQNGPYSISAIRTVSVVSKWRTRREDECGEEEWEDE